MSFIDGLTKNHAKLDPGADDPRLRPVLLATPVPESVERASSVIATLPRWSVVASDPEAGTLHATHATRIWGFVDDVHLRFEPRDDGTQIVGDSQSRVGKGDFGQNARNLRELNEALRRQKPSIKAPAPRSDAQLR